MVSKEWWHSVVEKKPYGNDCIMSVSKLTDDDEGCTVTDKSYVMVYIGFSASEFQLCENSGVNKTLSIWHWFQSNGQCLTLTKSSDEAAEWSKWQVKWFSWGLRSRMGQIPQPVDNRSGLNLPLHKRHSATFAVLQTVHSDRSISDEELRFISLIQNQCSHIPPCL